MLKKYRLLKINPNIIIAETLDIDTNLFTEFLIAINHTGNTNTIEEISPGT